MPRVDLYADQFDEFIEQKGMTARWEEALQCHCLSYETGQPDFTCKICSGTGFIYLPPKEIKVLTSSFNGNFDLESIGLIQKGSALVSTKSTDLLGYRDKLIFPDFNCKYSQVVCFYDGKSNKLHKPAKKIIRLIAPEAEYIPTAEETKPEDFKISEDGYYIEWLNIETWPPDEIRMALLYITSPSYIVDDTIHELRATWIKFKQKTDTFRELPKQYSLRREDFIYDYQNNRLDTEYL